MSRNFSVALSMLLNSAQYTQALGSVQKSTQSFASKAMGWLGGVFAVGSLIAFVKSAVAGYNETAQANAKMNAVLLSTQGIAGVTSGAIKKMTGDLSNTTLFSKTALTDAAAVLLTFTKIGRDTFPQVMTAAVNMSTVLGTDLHASIIQLGKAMNSPATGMMALKKSGVSFTEAQIDMIRKLQNSGNLIGAQNIILKELATEFGGAGEAAARAGTGPIEMITKKFIALKKSVGEAIIESKSFQNGMNSFADTMNDVVYVALSKSMTEMQSWKALADILFGDGADASGMIRRAKEEDEYAQHSKDAAEAIGGAWQNLKKLNDTEFHPKKPIVEKSDAEIEEEKKAKEEAYDAANKLLEKHKAEQLIIITDQLRNGQITEGIFKEAEIQASIEFYAKQIELLKKFGKDSTSVQLQMSQERSKLMNVSLMPGAKNGGSVKSNNDTPTKEPELQGVFSAERIYSDRQKEEAAIEEAGKEREKQVTNLNNQLASSIGSGISEIGASFGESIGKMLGGMEASDAFSGFGNSILKMIGQFLISLGSALITYGVLMSAFFTDMEPTTKIAIGAAAVVAGGVLLGIASAGPKGSTSTGSSSSSSGNSYNSPGSSKTSAENKVVFEIKGSALVGVLANEAKRNLNTQ